MSRINKIAKIILILYILSCIVPGFASGFISKLVDTGVIFRISILLNDLLLMFENRIESIMNLLLGIGLFMLCRKEQNSPGWFWLLLCIVFGIYAPILFVLIRIYNHLKGKETSLDKFLP